MTGKQLAAHFTVYNYDRRGRGHSSDTAPYAVEREVEDIESLIHEAAEAPICSAVHPAPCWPLKQLAN
ncbi:hypothetical protein ABEX29_06895 [Brevibacillus porteri]|uniref:alpha/beta fold hydrolase n=1 Tax=Brevibacillus TaxID=55080 RepID=UPI000474C7A4|nr:MULTISPECIES: hypothetical protein [unclassified Brevibacillus]